MLRQILTAATATVMAAGAANAADLLVLQPQPMATYSPGFSWTGLYIGALGGYGWGTVDTDIPGAPEYHPRGFVGGVHAGYNYDLGGLVLGAEADFNLSDIVYSEVFMAATTSLRIDNFGSVRARVGIPVDRFLPYVTGGLAMGTGSFNVTVAGATISEHQTHTGWTIGAGAEYAVADNVTVRAEYLYTDLGSRTYLNGLLPPGVDARVNFGTVRAGVSFKF